MKTVRLLDISRTLLRLHNELHEAAKKDSCLVVLAMQIGIAETEARMQAYRLEYEENPDMRDRGYRPDF